MQDLNDTGDDMIVLVMGKNMKKTTAEIEDLSDKILTQNNKLISWSVWMLGKQPKILDLKRNCRILKTRWGIELVLNPFSIDFQFKKCKTS